MIADIFEIKKTVNKGEGLFAREFIPKGTIIGFECDKCKKRDFEELKKLSDDELKWITEHEYIDKSGRYSNVCDKKILILNHSCNSNILFCDLGFDIAVRDIKKGEEATYDYRIFYDDLNFICKCNEKNCCKIVKSIHPIPKELKEKWEVNIQEALKKVNEVNQPLKEELIKNKISLPII